MSESFLWGIIFRCNRPAPPAVQRYDVRPTKRKNMANRALLMIRAILPTLLFACHSPEQRTAGAGTESNLEEAHAFIVEGSGSFLMNAGRGHDEIAVRVYYHRPRNFSEISPVLIVLPGAGRNGDDYRDSWIEASEEYGVLVLSPSYPEKYYDVADYHLCGVIKNLELRNVETQENPQVYRMKDEDFVFDINDDSRQWLFHDFDRLFEIVVSAVGSKQLEYDMFGHSAGGQILHRLAIFHPESKANRILASNSGFYTLPRLDVALPFGIEGTRLTKQNLARAFRERLVLFLGELDDAKETRGRHLHTPKADEQGLGRLARGRTFFTESQKVAAALDADFRWTIEVVPGVGHDYAKMGAAAARFLYATTQ